MLNFILIIVRISLFVIIMESLHFLIKHTFSISLPLGFGLCAFIVAVCFLVAAIVDGRLVRPLTRLESGRLSKTVTAALFPPREL